MRKPALFLACLLLSAGALAQEHITSDGTRFTATDDSPAAQLCMAALESREALRAKARELEISRREQKQVVCNDMSLVEFARAHRDDIREWAIATVQ